MARKGHHTRSLRATSTCDMLLVTCRERCRNQYSCLGINALGLTRLLLRLLIMDCTSSWRYTKTLQTVGWA